MNTEKPFEYLIVAIIFCILAMAGFFIALFGWGLIVTCP